MLKQFTHPETIYLFKYPEEFKILLANTVVFVQEDGENLIKILRLPNKNNNQLSVFVKWDYQEVTVNNQKALNQIDKDSFQLYLSWNQEIFKIYVYKKDYDKISNLLSTFSINKNIHLLKQCWWLDNIICERWFRCEITRWSQGVCIDINAEVDYESYETYGAVNSEEWIVNSEEWIVENINSQNIRSDSSGAVTVKNLELESVDEGNSEQFILTERLWTLELSLWGTYNNSYHDFSLNYPKGWWFKSFWTKTENIWYIEFDKKEIENIWEGSIILKIKKWDEKKKYIKSKYPMVVIAPKDDESYFSIELENLKFSEEALWIADSIQLK